MELLKDFSLFSSRIQVQSISCAHKRRSGPIGKTLYCLFRGTVFWECQKDVAAEGWPFKPPECKDIVLVFGSGAQRPPSAGTSGALQASPDLGGMTGFCLTLPALRALTPARKNSTAKPRKMRHKTLASPWWRDAWAHKRLSRPARIKNTTLQKNMTPPLHCPCRLARRAPTKAPVFSSARFPCNRIVQAWEHCIGPGQEKTYAIVPIPVVGRTPSTGWGEPPV